MLHLYQGTIYLVKDRQQNNGEADTRIHSKKQQTSILLAAK